MDLIGLATASSTSSCCWSSSSCSWSSTSSATSSIARAPACACTSSASASRPGAHPASRRQGTPSTPSTGCPSAASCGWKGRRASRTTRGRSSTSRCGPGCSILLAGVAMNFLLAWLIFSLIAGLADPVAERAHRLCPGRVARSGGRPRRRLTRSSGTGTAQDGTTPCTTTPGDLIIAIDGQRFPVFDRVEDAIHAVARVPARACRPAGDADRAERGRRRAAMHRHAATSATLTAPTGQGVAGHRRYWARPRPRRSSTLR